LTLCRDDPNVFPFLQLPVKVRDLVYEHAAKTSGFDKQLSKPKEFSWALLPAWYSEKIHFVNRASEETSTLASHFACSIARYARS
jgi:hypothetical protein